MTTLDYHVYLLCRCGLVYKMRDGKYCRYYSGEVDERTHLCVSALRKPRKKEILSVVLSGGLISYRELSCMVGVRQSTLSHHIGELVADGILRRVRVGKEFYYTPVDRCHLAGVFNGLKGDALK